MPPAKPIDPHAYVLTVKDVCRLIDPTNPIHRTTLWRWVKAGDVPQPTKIGKRKRWCYADFGVVGPSK